MIGNDLVDLRLAAKETDWSRPRWREKVFTKEENALLDESSDPFQVAWRMWSMKESAYKAHVRRFPQRFLQPKKMQCDIRDSHSGTVTIDGVHYCLHSDTIDHFIHSRAGATDPASLLAGLIELSAEERRDRHRELEERFFDRYRRIHRVGTTHLEVKSNGIGTPILHIDGRSTDTAFSLSYDGNMGAYVFADESLRSMSSRRVWDMNSKTNRPHY